MTKPQFDTLHIERYDSGGYRITINPRPVQEGTTYIQFEDMKFANDLDELMDWIGHLAENQADDENALAWKAEKEEQARLARELQPSSVEDLAETPIIQDLITQIDEQKSRIESLEQTSGARTARMQGYTREHYELSTRLKKTEESCRSIQSIILRLEERISGLEDRHDGLNNALGLLRREIASLKADDKEVYARDLRLQEQIDTLQGRLDGLNKCYGKYASDVQGLQAGQSEIAAELQAAIQKGKKSKTEVDGRLDKLEKFAEHRTIPPLTIKTD